ncbi:UNKNOWN [Stylonychia lemnae]|uniref:Uncharacterized protein n=1 Tax=Stylonychia lemnae TaxID=5949 RepID=A0A078AIF2_STYLE|nr:UNKNOWN [Stylonychia lemnae]|eukprot:CDW81721.1 UNKNOWN [Stylonychia lemnae]
MSMNYLGNAENIISADMQETMKRLVKIEKLAEEIMNLKQEMIEYDRKRNHNRECLGAFRRGEIKQQSSKLWISYGDNMIRLPRKNLLAIVEGDQVKLNKLIDGNRVEIKKKIKELIELSPNITEMDPYVVKLVLKQDKLINKQKLGVIQSESDEEDSDGIK